MTKELEELIKNGEAAIKILEEIIIKNCESCKYKKSSSIECLSCCNNFKNKWEQKQ
jgi:hypothetical protein